MNQAHGIMFAMHGAHFCTVYTEEEWNEWVEKAKSRGYSYEKPLDYIATAMDIEETAYHTDYTGTKYELK